MSSKWQLFLVVFLVSGCGGSGGGSSNLDSVPIPPVAENPWAEVDSVLAASEIDELALLVGNSSGELFRHEKGSFEAEAVYQIASASKWLTSATLLALVEQGVMQLDDRPQDYLDYWSRDPADWRSAITLEQLLSFTAGFHRSPSQPGCIGNEAVALQDCVAEWYAIGVDAAPGTTFHYGPVHMQVAAAMAEVASGQRWQEVVELTLAIPYQLGSIGFAGNNPRASGGATSSAEAYAKFLQVQLSGNLIPLTLDTLAMERTTALMISSKPASLTQSNADWHYGLGAWRECNQPVWDAQCDTRMVVSSPGAFGWYPWIDLDNGYYAVLAMEEPLTLLSSPTEVSVSLGTQLQPLIEQALANSVTQIAKP